MTFTFTRTIASRNNMKDQFTHDELLLLEQLLEHETDPRAEEARRKVEAQIMDCIPY